jgi:hypothetical protein
VPSNRNVKRDGQMVTMDDKCPGQGRAQEAALFVSTGFREESSGQPLVYGYVRSVRWQSDYVAVCRRALERYCQRERLRMCAVFADRGVGDDVTVRPGLTGLCDVLRLPDSFAAVLLSLTHLSRDSHVATQLREQVRGTGARLLVVRPTTKDAAGSVSLQHIGQTEWWQ